MSAVRPPMRGRASWQASASGQSSRPIAARGSPDSACGSSACARSGCADPLARRSTECIGHPSCSSHPTCPRSGEEAASATDAWAAAAARTRPRPVSAATRADGEAGWVWRARGYRVPLGQGLTLRMAPEERLFRFAASSAAVFLPLPGSAAPLCAAGARQQSTGVSEKIYFSHAKSPPPLTSHPFTTHAPTQTREWEFSLALSCRHRVRACVSVTM